MRKRRVLWVLGIMSSLSMGLLSASVMAEELQEVPEVLVQETYVSELEFEDEDEIEEAIEEEDIDIIEDIECTEVLSQVEEEIILDEEVEVLPVEEQINIDEFLLSEENAEILAVYEAGPQSGESVTGGTEYIYDMVETANTTLGKNPSDYSLVYQWLLPGDTIKVRPKTDGGLVGILYAGPDVSEKTANVNSEIFATETQVYGVDKRTETNYLLHSCRVITKLTNISDIPVFFYTTGSGGCAQDEEYSYSSSNFHFRIPNRSLSVKYEYRDRYRPTEIEIDSDKVYYYGDTTALVENVSINDRTPGKSTASGGNSKQLIFLRPYTEGYSYESWEVKNRTVGSYFFKYDYDYDGYYMYLHDDYVTRGTIADDRPVSEPVIFYTRMTPYTTATLNAEGGTIEGYEKKIYTADTWSSNTLDTLIPVRTGYEFEGWYTNTSYETQISSFSELEQKKRNNSYDDCAEVIYSSDMENSIAFRLYAKWKHVDHSYVNGVCTECGNIADGFAYVNRKWSYYNEQQIRTDLNGLVEGIINGTNNLYYVESGTFVKISGITKKVTGGNWCYVKDGAFTEASGIAQKIADADRKWYYVEKGIFKKTSGITRIADGSSATWFYVKDGILTKANGIAQKIADVDRKWYYVEKGIFKKNSGIARMADGSSATWFYVKDGILTKASGIAQMADKSRATWFYVKDGIYTKTSGIAQKIADADRKWYYVKDGIFTKVSGIAQMADKSSKTWFYVKDGIFTKASGIAQMADKSSKTWFYVNNGIYTNSTCIALMADGSSKTRFYVKAGIYSMTTGTVTIGTTRYRVVKGVVQ